MTKETGLLSVTIDDAGVLQAAYMSFLVGGGLFIPMSPTDFSLGEELFMLLRLMGDDELPLAAKVVWLTPLDARHGREAGIGVQFNDPDDVARERIEAHLRAGEVAERDALESYTL